MADSAMPERVLFVHAHSGDESLSTGGTIATLLDSEASVTVLTCGRGDPARADELRKALGELGVIDHRWLGAPGARRAPLSERQYVARTSRVSGRRAGEGSAGVATHVDDSLDLARADIGEVAADIATVILDVDARAVISHAEHVGDPDRARTHEAARRAADVLGIPFFAIDATDSSAATVRLDVAPRAHRKRAAMIAHHSRFRVVGERFVDSEGDGVRRPIPLVESYRRLPPATAPAGPSLGSRIAAVALALVAGVLVGTVATIGHQSLPPWGLIAGLVATAGIIGGLRLVHEGRAVAGAAALGLIGASALLAGPGFGGSIIVPDNTLGWIWTFGPVLIVAVALAWPRTRLPSERG